MIHPFIFGKTAMCAVMHHIEPDSSDHTTQQYTFKDGPDNTRGKENKMNVDKDKADHQDHCLQEKAVITRGSLTYLFKIVTDPLLQLCVKRMGYVGKFGR
jgi:hypothetical protein